MNKLNVRPPPQRCGNVHPNPAGADSGKYKDKGDEKEEGELGEACFLQCTGIERLLTFRTTTR